MLELMPIGNDKNCCTACGHTREASEAFNPGWACPACGETYDNTVHTTDLRRTTAWNSNPAFSGYRTENNNNNIRRPSRKKTKRVKRGVSISGQKIVTWLGSAAILLALAIGVKSFQPGYSEKSNNVSVTIAHK